MTKKFSENLKDYFYVITVNDRREAFIPVPNSSNQFIELGYWSDTASEELFDKILSILKFKL